MLPPQPIYLPPDQCDQEIFEATVSQDHYLRRVKAVLDVERLRPLLAEAYCDAWGRPAVEPLLLLKLEFLQYQYNHSDRQVIEHSRSNMAYRFFLDLGLHSPLPHHTLLTYFRQRLGTERHQRVFDALVGQAREHGLVKDRLRLKDATHVLANVAIPTTIALVAQTRQRLLVAPWAAEEVQRQQQRAEQIRHSSADLSGEERLLQRVVHLRELVAWAQLVCAGSDFAAALPVQQQELQQALALASKVLEDRDDPDSTDQLRSVHDPDARHAKHGSFYVGYLLDVALDADSQIITALNVLPGGANEGADAETLLHREAQAHGPKAKVQALSLDSAGYQGPLLRTLTDPAGLNVEVFVPPREPARPRRTEGQAVLADPSL